jgi:hypothetical protein
MGSIRRKELERLVCERCSGEFTAVMPHARFCSAGCYGKAEYQKRSFSHKCVECGSDFTSKQHKASVCGRPECRLAVSVKGGKKGAAINSFPQIHPSRAYAYKLYADNRRDLLLKQPSERYSPEEIFARDGWVCQICHDPVDPSLKFPDKRSACIDHIHPIIAGGNDLRSNVQCAHFGCNSKKGASVSKAD